MTHPNFATVPVIDEMTHDTFEPLDVGYGFRGAFDWSFRYQYLPLGSQYKLIEGEPYELPMMTGGAYAIRREHFFHLGGYDEGLRIWNGENFEIGLKLWLCDGGILQCPCSRVAHLSKIISAHRPTDEDYEARNLKRVAEVWLDDYKKYFYRNEPERYSNTDTGDLTAMFEQKKSLNCKPFKYFLDVVAPEILVYYPIEPTCFASGTIKANADPQSRCLGRTETSEVVLVSCNKSQENDFKLTLERSIRFNDPSDQCFDAFDLKFANCNHQALHQLWKFDVSTRQIINPLLDKCLTVNTTGSSIYLDSCLENFSEQKWTWSYENQTALMDWDNFGLKINN